MGARDYQVLVIPLEHSPLRRPSKEHKATLYDVETVVRDLEGFWPSLHRDPAYCLNTGRTLVYETDTEVIELLVQLSFEQDYLYVSLRFAYCNPRSIYEPFCEMIEWLMDRYQMYCSPMRNSGPRQNGRIARPDAIVTAEKVQPVLIPSMDYNRRIWQQWVGSTEEVKLRPDETRAYFRSKREATE